MELQLKEGALPKSRKYLNDNSYQEFIKSSQEFNHKLVKDRKFRLPFLDSQTGVAQSDCCLWMSESDRRRNTQADDEVDDCDDDDNNNNGVKKGSRSSNTEIQSNAGRIYTYPAKRWVKRKRQYLLDDVYLRQRLAQTSTNQHLPSGPSSSNNLLAQDQQSMLIDHSSNDTHHPHLSYNAAHPHQNSYSTYSRMTDSGSHNTSFNNNHNDSINHNTQHPHHPFNNDSSFMHDSSSNSNAYPWTINEQSKDATTSSKIDPDESTSEATTAHGDLDDSNDPQHITHQQQNYTNHHNQSQNQSQSQLNNSTASSNTPTTIASTPTTAKKKRERKFKIEKTNDPLKPYKCEWCEMSYKTRPGLTYHRNHCHSKNVVSNSSDETVIGDEPSNSNNHVGNHSSNSSSSSKKASKASLAQTNHVAGSNSKTNGRNGTNHHSDRSRRNNGTAGMNSTRAQNNNDTSLYCDFCLGTSELNTKTQLPEELVSCSDCGRSGHPTCMTFTPNMILSVRKYSWQCLECKSCGLCGTSDNDDKLLFCDDCDRGYHSYCLDPPLERAPEGSWYCSLCLDEYHGGENGNKPESSPKEQAKEPPRSHAEEPPKNQSEKRDDSKRVEKRPHDNGDQITRPFATTKEPSEDKKVKVEA